MSIKEKAKAGIAWNVLADFGIQLLRFISSIILARILFPEDFGLMGIAAIFINFAKRLANFGFSAALVQKKEIEKAHIDSMFWFNTTIYGLISVGIYMGAAVAGEFFKNPELKNILPFVALAFLIESLSSVPDAVLKRKLKFKILAFSRLLRNMVNITLAIVMAILGFGVWSLVWGIVIGNFVRLLYILKNSGWRPSFKFSLNHLKEMAGFGVGVSLANYLNFFIKNTDYFLIGKFLGVTPLGFYERAFNLVNMTRRRVARNIKGVLFATYSQIQDENERIRLGLNRVLKSVSILSYPVHVLLFFIAPALIFNLYGAKWIPTIKPLQIMCFSGIINSLVVVFPPVLMSKKKVFSWTLLQIIYFIVLVIAILVALPYGISSIALAVALSSIIYLIGMIFITSKTIGFTFGDFWLTQRDLWLYIVPAVIGTYFFDLFLQKYYDPYSIIKAVFLTILFFGITSISHFIWRKSFVGEFVDEIFSFFKKGMAKVSGKTL